MKWISREDWGRLGSGGVGDVGISRFNRNVGILRFNQYDMIIHDIDNIYIYIY